MPVPASQPASSEVLHQPQAQKIKLLIRKTPFLWFYMGIRVLYGDWELVCDSLQPPIDTILQDVMKNLFHCNIVRFRRKTLHSPLSLVCTGEKNKPETWKGAKSGRLFLKTRKAANSIFRTFEFSQTVFEHHENLPSFHCQKEKKKNRMPLKFSKLFPCTFLKWICLTRISLVIILAK